MWNPLRSWLRDEFLRAFRLALRHDRSRKALTDEFRELASRGPQLLKGAPFESRPYDDLGRANDNHLASRRDDVVFVTGRFRSGTTLLWNIFRHAKGCTAYYEPFNERRWFDPAHRGSNVDSTHLGVADYWREYEGMQSLAGVYDESWTRRHLLMGGDAWNPRMKTYLEALIQNAVDRPVMKFNRLDFRLPWVRQNFPSAKIVHIYRHPRDQWCSTFLRTEPIPPKAGMAGFEERDEFYLLPWVRDLRAHFPFLDEDEVEHPYQLFYFVWKLSYLFGRKYADLSLRFEDFIANPRSELERLFVAIDMAGQPQTLDALSQLCAMPRNGRWHEYANEEWFVRHESKCEETLSVFFATAECSSQNEAHRAGDRRSFDVQPVVEGAAFLGSVV